MDRNIFSKTLTIGMKVLNINNFDFDKAYTFSEKHYLEVSQHFIRYFNDFYKNMKGIYEGDLTRYMYIKAIEQCVASEFYTHTSRGNVCDIIHQPNDIALPVYPANLPKNLELIVNMNQTDAKALAQAIMDEIAADPKYVFCDAVLAAVQYLGMMKGDKITDTNATYKGYPTTELLTRHELNKIAGLHVCKWLEKNEIKVIQVNFTRETFQNIIAQRNNQVLFICLSTDVAPVDPTFVKDDLDRLFSAAMKVHARAFYTGVSLTSANEKHQKDGVLLAGDEVSCKILAFNELKPGEDK